MPKNKNTAPKSQNDKKANTSLRLDPKTLKALKIHAAEADTSVQKIMETLIDGYLKKLDK